jgi:hypothetical protein
MAQDTFYAFPGQLRRGDVLGFQRSQLLLLLCRRRRLQPTCHWAAEFTGQIRIVLTGGRGLFAR